MEKEVAEKEKKQKQKIWVEKFKDGRPPVNHNHPIRRRKGHRPRPPGPLKRLIPREDWRAKPPKTEEMTELSLPITHIRYLQRGAQKCHTFGECSKLVHHFQKQDLKAGHPDIIYNFIVAPDGAVFEGRGWQYCCDLPEKYADLAGKCIDVGFIGKNNRKIPGNMLLAAKDLVDWGVYNYKARCCHEIIPLELPPSNPPRVTSDVPEEECPHIEQDSATL